jgi:aminomethyltransferase
VTRTGYTGDLGYELWVTPQHALPLWDRLMETGAGYGIVPAGMAALDIARIEAGLIMCGVDYISARKALIDEQRSTPAELGLGWAVDFAKPAFVGRKALLKERARGPVWKLVGLDVLWSDLEAVFGRWKLSPQVAGRASRASIPVYWNGRQAGEMTSHTFSPMLKRYIGLASLRSDAPGPGGLVEVEVTVEHTRLKAQARVQRLPFYNPPRKRQ